MRPADYGEVWAPTDFHSEFRGGPTRVQHLFAGADIDLGAGYGQRCATRAIQIARDWNVKFDGAGFVTRFEVDAYYLSQYPVQKVGGDIHTEHWIPAEDLPEFNRNIVGQIAVTTEFR
jgi:hypothetical protein